MRHMTNFSISPSPKRVFPKVRTWLAQELMRSQELDANKDPMDPLEQVAILGNHPYLLQSMSLSMKSSFIMETTSISYILRQVNLEPFVKGVSVVRMTVRISRRWLRGTLDHLVWLCWHTGKSYRKSRQHRHRHRHRPTDTQCNLRCLHAKLQTFQTFYNTHTHTHTYTLAHTRTQRHTRTHTHCNLYCLNDKAHTFEIYYDTHTHTHTHTHVHTLTHSKC